jgi:hypothetical protein
MQWIRAAAWVVASASLGACTRNNPAFETGGEETFGEGETGVETGEIGESDESDTSTIAECEYDEGQALTIKLPQPCGETNDNTQRYEWSFLVVATTETGWIGGLCSDPTDLGCAGDCPVDVVSAIELGPFDVSGLAGAGACLRIRAAQVDPALESCNFDAVGIWDAQKPIVIAGTQAVMIGDALDEAGQIAPLPVLAEDPVCACVDECCVVSPGDYAFDVEGQNIPVGSSAVLANHPYVLHSLSAFNPTGCAEDLNQAWALTYSG